MNISEHEQNIQQGIAAWLQANDFRTHYPVLVTLKELKGKNGIGELAVLWTMAEIVASVNRGEPEKLAEGLRDRIICTCYPQPVPRLLIDALERAAILPEFRALMTKTGHSAESLIGRLKTPVCGVDEPEFPEAADAMEYFRKRQPMRPEWTLADDRKEEYLKYASVLLFDDDPELARAAAGSVGYGSPDGIFSLMKRILALQGKELVPFMMESAFPSVRAAAIREGIDRQTVWPLLHDPEPLVRAAAANAVIRDLAVNPCGDPAEFAAALNKEAQQVGDTNYADQLNYLFLIASKTKHYLRFIYPFKSMPVPMVGRIITSVITVVLAVLFIWFLDRMINTRVKPEARIFYWAATGLLVAVIVAKNWITEWRKEKKILQRAGRWWPTQKLGFLALENQLGTMADDYSGAVIIYGTEAGLDTYVIDEAKERLFRISPDTHVEGQLPELCVYSWRVLKRQLHLHRNYMLQMHNCGLPRPGHVIINAFYSRPALKPLVMTIEDKIDGGGLAHGIFGKALPELIQDMNFGGEPVKTAEAPPEVPHVFKDFIAELVKEPFPKIEPLVGYRFYRLICPCGHDGFSVYGYRKKESGETPELYPPLSMECTVCGVAIPFHGLRETGETELEEYVLDGFYRLTAGLSASGLLTVYGMSSDDNWQRIFDWELRESGKSAGNHLPR